MKKSFKLLLAAAFLVTEFFVIALPILTTSAKADGEILIIETIVKSNKTETDVFIRIN